MAALLPNVTLGRLRAASSTVPRLQAPLTTASRAAVAFKNGTHLKGSGSAALRLPPRMLRGLQHLRVRPLRRLAVVAAKRTITEMVLEAQAQAAREEAWQEQHVSDVDGTADALCPTHTLYYDGAARCVTRATRGCLTQPSRD